MELLGYIASALIGISLGMIGGGGAILTVPVMVYLFGINPLIATSYSLFIVGTSSLIASLNSYRKGLVNLKAVLFFGTSSIITVFITRKFIIPLLPHDLFRIADFKVTSSVFTMMLFGVLMMVASIGMIRGEEEEQPEDTCSDCLRFFKLLGYGLGIGLITGFLGAGGGFLMVPALVLLVRLPMKVAVGTSLLIIALNSLMGFAGDLGHFHINWTFLLTVTGIAVIGIYIGGLISKRLSAHKLKKGFGWFVLFMGVLVIVKELLL